MALGVNLQWGFAGLFNVGVMGFVALGGPCHGAGLDAARTGGAGRPGGARILAGLILGAGAIAAAAIVAWKQLLEEGLRGWAVAAILVVGFFLYPHGLSTRRWTRWRA